MKKYFAILVSIMLLIAVLMLGVTQVGAVGTVYIRADGSIDPPTAPVSTTDNITYYIMGNTNDHIVVQRSSIIVEGNGFTMDGYGVIGDTAFYLSSINNVTIQNVTIYSFSYAVEGIGVSRIVFCENTVSYGAFGVFLDSSNNNVISSNHIENNDHPVYLLRTSNTSVIGNYIKGSGSDHGISLVNSDNNRINFNHLDGSLYDSLYFYNSRSNSLVGNTITGSFLAVFMVSASDSNLFSYNNISNNLGEGFVIDSSSFNTLSGNNISSNGLEGVRIQNGSNYNNVSCNFIADNLVGVGIVDSIGNRVFHNVFAPSQTHAMCSFGTNSWDDGYPSGGNYWSDYAGVDVYSGPYQNETGSDGIGDTPYTINANNHDDYPFISTPRNIAILDVHTMKAGCSPLPTVCSEMPLQVYVTAENQGLPTEVFNITLFANDMLVGEQTITLTYEQAVTLTFMVNTSSFSEYTSIVIVANLTQLPSETDYADNSFVDEAILLTHMGDVTGDEKVDIDDLARVSGGFGSVRVSDPQDPRYGKYWHPVACGFCPHTCNADINGDGKIDITDVAMTSSQFGWFKPP